MCPVRLDRRTGVMSGVFTALRRPSSTGSPFALRPTEIPSSSALDAARREWLRAQMAWVEAYELAESARPRQLPKRVVHRIGGQASAQRADAGPARGLCRA